MGKAGAPGPDPLAAPEAATPVSSSRASSSCAGSTTTVTGSNRAMPRATSAHSLRASSMSGPKRSARQGQESRWRWCGSKRAGRVKPSARGVVATAPPIVVVGLSLVSACVMGTSGRDAGRSAGGARRAAEA